MKSLVSICLSVVVFMVASPAGAAESWVYGVGVSKAAAKEAALEVASANLPIGVAFHVAEENFVANSAGVASTAGSTPAGWTCNILVRYGTGVSVVEGVTVYHAHPHAKSATKPAGKTPKTTKTTKPAKTTGAPKVKVHPTTHGTATR
jgi:hypothetical protein